MQVCNGLDKPDGIQRPEAGEVTYEIPDNLKSAERALDLVYDLRVGTASSEGFYREAAEFCDRVVAELELRAGWLIGEYAKHVQAELREAERSRGEYGLDLLVLGLVQARYLGAAESTPRWVVGLASELYWLRREAPWTRAGADLGRAALHRYFLGRNIGRRAKPGPCTLKRLWRLTDWLQATGEFEQEIRRLNNWRSFLKALPEAEAHRWMNVSVEAFDWFEREAAGALSQYMAGVGKFLAGEHALRGMREDEIFCGRSPVEYHLAMVAAEAMNRGLREQFDRKPNKVVLVPACMARQKVDACRAQVAGPDMTCASCDPECAINRISVRMRRLGAEVYLVPHATGFSRWLARWQREPETGVVAVACLMNILPGGYEMRARRIASQCVPLDFPGCKKHWRRERLATRANEERLVEIVRGTSSGSIAAKA